MDNEQSLLYWEEKAKSNPTITTSKVLNLNDFSDYDKEFILKYTNEKSLILDLAAGTGITLNKYYENVGRVVAVEKFKEFSDFIVKAKNIKIVNQNIVDYESLEKFDIVLMFGVLHYFNRSETEYLLKKYKRYLRQNGKLIIKGQYGVKEDVVVQGYSDELKCDYYSEYRYIQSEVELLKEIGYKQIELVDIYPKECNRWENTHFYAIVSTI